MNFRLLIKDATSGKTHTINACDSIRISYQSTLMNEYELLIFGYNGQDSGIIRFEDMIKDLSKVFKVEVEMYIEDTLFKTISCGLHKYDVSDVTNPHSGKVEFTELLTFKVFK